MIERREENLKVFVIGLECNVGGILTLYKSIETQRMFHYLHICDMGNHNVSLSIKAIAWSETHHSWNASEIDLPCLVLHGRCGQKTGQRNTDVVGLEDAAGIIAWIVFQNPLVGFHPKVSIVVVLQLVHTVSVQSDLFAKVFDDALPRLIAENTSQLGTQPQITIRHDTECR